MPVRSPWRSRIAATMRVVDDLPLVPTTWIDAKRRWGMPRTVISLCMRSRPKRMPNSSRPSRYSSAWRAFIRPGAPARPGTRRASGARPRPRRGRLLHEAGVPELSLRPINLGAKLLAPCREPSLCLIGIEGVRTQHLHGPAGHGQGRQHVAVLLGFRKEVEASQAADVSRRVLVSL